MSVCIHNCAYTANIPVAWPEMTAFTGLPEFGLKAKREHAERDESIARLQLIKKGTYNHKIYANHCWVYGIKSIRKYDRSRFGSPAPTTISLQQTRVAVICH